MSNPTLNDKLEMCYSHHPAAHFTSGFLLKFGAWLSQMSGRPGYPGALPTVVDKEQQIVIHSNARPEQRRDHRYTRSKEGWKGPLPCGLSSSHHAGSPLFFADGCPKRWCTEGGNNMECPSPSCVSERFLPLSSLLFIGFALSSCEATLQFSGSTRSDVIHTTDDGC